MHHTFTTIYPPPSLVRIYLLTLFFLFPIPAHAELFRWTDENGKVHFSDQPPEDQQVQSEEFTVKAPPKIGQENTQAIMERAQRLINSENDIAASKRRAVENSKRDFYQKRCAQAREDLKILSGRVRYVNKQGERYDVSEERVAEDRARIKKWVEEHCQDY